MFGISGEHVVILAIVLLIFGPRRLPELGNTLGKAIRNFKDAISGVEEASFRRIEEEKSKTAANHAAEPAAAPAQAQPTESVATAPTDDAEAPKSNKA